MFGAWWWKESTLSVFLFLSFFLRRLAHSNECWGLGMLPGDGTIDLTYYFLSQSEHRGRPELEHSTPSLYIHSMMWKLSAGHPFAFVRALALLFSLSSKLKSSNFLPDFSCEQWIALYTSCVQCGVVWWWDPTAIFHPSLIIMTETCGIWQMWPYAYLIYTTEQWHHGGAGIWTHNLLTSSLIS